MFGMARLSCMRMWPSHEKGGLPRPRPADGVIARAAVLFEDYKYFFYITNDMTGAEAITRGVVTPAGGLVHFANERCDQENLIAQLKGGVHALRMDALATPLRC